LAVSASRTSCAHESKNNVAFSKINIIAPPPRMTTLVPDILLSALRKAARQRSGQRERVMESRGNASGAGLGDGASPQNTKSG
jgi:hypothetical protein